MSTDKRITTDLIETLEDGKKGFANAAERLADTDRADLGPAFTALSEQRATFSAELETMAAAYGDDIDEDGSVLAAAHRSWLAVKDTLSGSDPDGVLDAAEQGEDHAVAQYKKALEADISAGLRTVVERQFTDVKQAHNQVKAWRNAT